MHQFFRQVVIENKIVDYHYFMDELQQHELLDILEVLPWATKNSYEQMRYLVWGQLKPYLKDKNITPDKLIPLYTDDDPNIEKPKPLEEDEVKALREQVMRQWTGKS